MIRTERNVFAPAIVDGMLRQDVAQTTVSFSHHRLVAPAADAAACRLEFGVRLLRRLAGLVLERITSLEEQAMRLEQRKAMLGTRLRLLHLRRNGLESLAGDAVDVTGNIASLERELEATVDDYREAKASLATLETRLGHIQAIFGAPAEHVNLVRSVLRVNRLGYEDETGSELELHELSIGEGPSPAIAFVRCRRNDVPARETLAGSQALL